MANYRENSVPSIMERNKAHFEANNMRTTKTIRAWFDDNWQAQGMEKKLESDGQIPGTLKKWGWTKERSSSEKQETNTTIKTLSFSENFKDAMRHLHITGYVKFQPGYITLETIDGNSVTVNPETKAWLERELFAEPLNPVFNFAVRHIGNNDWTLAGVETPAMRQARINNEKLASDKLADALKLVTSSGFNVVSTEFFNLFSTKETYAMNELSTIRFVESMETFVMEEAESARLERIKAYLVKKDKLAHVQTLRVQSDMVSQSIQIDADARITDAMKEANKALAERDAAIAAQKAMEERLAKLEALLSGQSAKPVPKNGKAKQV